MASDTSASDAENTSVGARLSYFEIPVSDMQRAVAFYSGVFEITLERTTLDGYEMALFPDEGDRAANGALAKATSMSPAK
ncbi:MAG: VOC family protein [Pseudomonadota bacterium]